MNFDTRSPFMADDLNTWKICVYHVCIYNIYIYLFIYKMAMAHMHLNLKTYPLSLCIDFVFDIKIAGCDTNLVFFSDKVR